MQTTFYEISFFHILVAKWISNFLKIFLLVSIKFPKINNSYFLTTIFFAITFLFGVLFLLTRTIIAHIKFTSLLFLPFLNFLYNVFINRKSVYIFNDIYIFASDKNH